MAATKATHRRPVSFLIQASQAIYTSMDCSLRRIAVVARLALVCVALQEQDVELTHMPLCFMSMVNGILALALSWRSSSLLFPNICVYADAR